MQHKMTNIDVESKTGICAVDGLVKAYRKANGTWACYPKKRENQKRHEQRWGYDNKYGQGAYAKKIAFLESQDYSCALCKREVDMTTGCLDHSHSTGKLRGVLCIKCNTGLGFFMDDEQLLLAASKYVSESS